MGPTRADKVSGKWSGLAFSPNAATILWENPSMDGFFISAIVFNRLAEKENGC
jgi:hypothetical protein